MSYIATEALLDWIVLSYEDVHLVGILHLPLWDGKGGHYVHTASSSWYFVQCTEILISKILLCTIMVHDMVAKREVGLAKKGLCNGEFAFPPILFLLLRCSCCSCLGLVYTDGIAGLSIRTGVLGGLSG